MSEECKSLECCPPAIFGHAIEDLPTYYNEEVSYTVECPEGFTCDPAGYTVTIPAGTIRFTPPRRGSPSGGGGGGTTPPAQPSGTINGCTYTNWQEYVNCLARQQAKEEAEASVTYVNTAPAEPFWNTEQTANCPAGETGDPVTIPAHTYFSNISQADANAQALAAAEAALECDPSCQTLLLDGLTWTFSQNGTGGTGSGSGASGELTVNANNAVHLTSSTLTNNCGVPFDITIDVAWTLTGRTINFFTDSPGALIRTTINGTPGDTIGGFTTNQCGNSFCPCETQSGNTSRTITLNPGQTLVIMVSIGQDVGTEACTPGSATFDISYS